MRVGIAFPTTDIGNDPMVIRDFVQAAEELGYDHLTIIDHVIQGRQGKGGWRDFYSLKNPFHEVFVVLGYIAALTKRIELCPAVLIMPQRQTVLVAKQAAEIDVLSAGRLRLGVGLGWNALEYGALGENFHDRGRRMEEQVEVLRRLWSEELVTFRGRWHTIEDAGLNPLPVQRPIPLWFGAFEERAIRRAGRLGDGLFVNPRVGASEARDSVRFLREAAVSVGRDPAAIGIDATLHVGDRGMQEIATEAEEWRGLGATHVTLRTMYSGMGGIGDHIDAMRRFRETWRPSA